MVLDLYNFWNNHRFIDHRIIYLEREPLRLFRPIPPFEAVPIRPDNPRFCHSLCRQVHICCLTILMIKNSTKENQTKKTRRNNSTKQKRKKETFTFCLIGILHVPNCIHYFLSCYCVCFTDKVPFVPCHEDISKISLSLLV